MVPPPMSPSPSQPDAAFRTERLEVGPWHDVAERWGIDLVEMVCAVLPPTTTASLPPDWHGDYDHDRAGRWIDERDAESPTLLIVHRAARRAIGLLVVFEDRQPGGGEELATVHLGYVLEEAAWGQGFASEVVEGFVDWARRQPTLSSISAGVAVGNEASAAVLVKNGFVPIGDHDGERRYELALRSWP